MIIGTMTTFPARSAAAPVAVASIAPQLDRLNLVLNEYREVPDWVRAVPNLVPILPAEDSKDTGKFLAPVAAEDWLFTLDDDIVFPPDYVARTIGLTEALGPGRFMTGYHGVTYRRPRYLRAPWLRRLLGRDPNYIVGSRTLQHYRRGLDQALVVDQLGTGVALMRGADVPAHAAVADAKLFIDARVARLCHEQAITRVCLPRAADWLQDVDQPGTSEGIFDSFTLRRPGVVAAEVERFACREPRVGTRLPIRPPAAARPVPQSAAPARSPANGEL